MRTNQLVSGVIYATCEAKAIRPVEPIHSRWVKQQVYNEQGVRVVNDKGQYVYEFVDKSAIKNDPWQEEGSCSVPIRGAGILVEVFDTDRDGKIIGEGTKRIVRPADIAGTWKEYLTLHGERHRLEKDRAEVRSMVQSRKKEIEDKARSIFGQIPLNGYPDSHCERVHVVADRLVLDEPDRWFRAEENLLKRATTTREVKALGRKFENAPVKTELTITLHDEDDVYAILRFLKRRRTR